MSHSVKKQLAMILLAVVLVLSLAVVLTACGEHEHTYSTAWSADADYHWHKPTCNDTKELKDREQHSFNEEGVCTVCNYLHEHTFSTEWKKSSANHWHEATCEHKDEKSDLDAHSYDENDKCTVCGYDKGHQHTYSGWLVDEYNVNHYKLPTCDDTDEMIGPFPHVDEDGDGVCDVCLTANFHIHSFSTEWSHDEDGHWKAATCHSDAKSEYAEHVDEDDNGYGDGVCDVCGYPELPHEHKFEQEWTFDERVHWHVATCTHFMERGDYALHSFNGRGVCKCGVEKSYVDVYDLYTRTGNLTFVEWLRWLAENNVVRVEKTESGDGIYYYKDGSSEFAFLGDRIVKVKAVDTEGNPLARVWVMVSEYTSDEIYVEVGGTTALGIAETDANGFAEIIFSPIDGYSSAVISYHLRIAEAKDVAVYLGIDEEDARPIPNRYGVAEGFEYAIIEVGENASDAGVVELEFSYSIGWSAYDKFYLPYRRYYTDALHAEGLVEEGFEYELTTSGDNLFDYFYFSPQQYDYRQGRNPDENIQIVENAKVAASGNYRISFTIEGDATAVLYFWDEDGIHLDGAGYKTNADGTPHNDYITAISGEGDGNYYSGGNFIEVVISPELGLRLFQLGIKSDVECKVTFTVERTGDYDPYKPHYYMEKLEDGKYGVEDKLTFIAYKTALINFALPEVPAGLYTISLEFPSGATGEYKGEAGMYYAYTPRTSETDKVSVWQGDGLSGNNARRQCKGIIRIHEGDDVLSIENNATTTIRNITVLLEKYELPDFNADGEYAYLPVAPESWGNPFTNALIASPGTYTLEINAYVKGYKNDPVYTEPMKAHIGGREFTTGAPEISAGNPMLSFVGLTLTYTVTVTVTEQDSTISLLSALSYSLTARVKLTAVA